MWSSASILIGIIAGYLVAMALGMVNYGKIANADWFALPMPLQSQVTEAPLARVTKLAQVGHEGANQLVTSWIGQGVGLMNTTQSAKAIVYEFMQDYLEASERLSSSLQD